MDRKGTDDPYDLAPEPQRRPSVRAATESLATPAPAPAAVRPVVPAPATPVGPRPLAYKAPEPADDAEAIRNLYMPLGFLLAGLAIELFVAFRQSPTLTTALTAAAGDVTHGLLGRTAVMTVAMLIAARLRQIDLGPLPLTLLKLSAVAVVPPALATLGEPILGLIPPFFVFGLAVVHAAGLVVVFALHYALLGAFFDLDESDTWYCVMVTFVVGVASEFGMAALAAYL